MAGTLRRPRQCVHRIESRFESSASFVGSVRLHQDFALRASHVSFRGDLPPQFRAERARHRSSFAAVRSQSRRVEVSQRPQFFDAVIKALQRFFCIATFFGQILGTLDEKLGTRFGRSVIARV